MVFMGQKYDYFDEQNDQIKKDQLLMARQVEQMAKDQAKESIRRTREASRRMADLAEKEAIEGAAAGGAKVSAGGAVSAGSGATAGSATPGGASAGGVGAGTAGTAGAAAFWKVILIILIVLCIIVILYFLISAVVKLSGNLKSAKEDETINLSMPAKEQSVNNAEYVLKLLENGNISLESATTGAFDDDYAKQVLEAVVKEKESRGEHIRVRYEGKPWVLIKDANGKTLDELIEEIKDCGETPPDYYVDDNGESYTNAYGTWQEADLSKFHMMKPYTVLSRRDIETTSFTVDYFDDPYELRWQPVYVLCQMRIANVAKDWGKTGADGKAEALKVEELSTDGVGDYFLKEKDILYCIDCFMPKFRYTWNPIEEGLDGTEFSYDDDKLLAYLEDDQRNRPEIGGNTPLGGRAYVFHKPSVAASSIDLGYRKILFNITDQNGTYRITSRTIKETPKEWLEKLNFAAGGYFSESEFLYLLSLLPGTEDLVEEYRKIFASDDGQSEDFTIDGCVGAFLKDEVRASVIPGANGFTTGLDIQYNPTGESVILEFRDCYINQGDPKWGSTLRGDGRVIPGTDPPRHYTIGNSGCIDCCYAMCCHYFNQTCIPMADVSTKFVGGQSFQFGSFCSAFRMDFKQDKSGSLPKERIKKHLMDGNPVIMQIKGRWVDGNGRVLHASSSTHYIVIYGYDERGFYLADPGNGANSKGVPVSFEDMEKATVLDTVFLTSTDPAFYPSYSVKIW